MNLKMNTVLVDENPIAPGKIVCVGRNYVDHISELGNEIPDDMVVFIKPNSAITDTLMSYHDEPLHYEGEICLMVSNGQFSALGFGLDITKRILQSKLKSNGLPWERAKAFNGSAVFSPFVSITNISPHLSIELDINDRKCQVGGVDLMMYKPNDILNELQSFITLNDGDIVMTGTPKGVGIINKGDRFHGQIKDGTNRITSAKWQAI